MSRDSTFTYVHIDDPNRIVHMEKWQDDKIVFDDIDTDALVESTLMLFPHFFFEEDDDNNVLMNSSNFGLNFLKNKKKFLKEKIWNDLNLYDKFLKSTSDEIIDKTILNSIYTKTRDSNANNSEIIESRELTVGEFLSNGYNLTNSVNSILSLGTDMINDSMVNNELSVNSLSYINHNTFTNTKLNSLSHAQSQQQQQQQQQHQSQQSQHQSQQQQQPQQQSQLQQQPQPQQSQHQYQQSQLQTPKMARTRQSSTDRIFQTPITRIMR